MCVRKGASTTSWACSLAMSAPRCVATATAKAFATDTAAATVAQLPLPLPLCHCHCHCHRQPLKIIACSLDTFKPVVLSRDAGNYHDMRCVCVSVCACVCVWSRLPACLLLEPVHNPHLHFHPYPHPFGLLLTVQVVSCPGLHPQLHIEHLRRHTRPHK